MIIIGIDPGTIITGYGIILFDGTRYRVLDFGCIRPPANLKLTDRYLIIYEGITELLEKHKPQRLAIETQFVKHNVQSAIKLGMARGIILVPPLLRKIPIFEYAPTEIKRAVCGTGRASKVQVQGTVKQLLNLKEIPYPEDAADALAIAICDSHNGRVTT